MTTRRSMSLSVLAVLVAACSGAGNDDLFESGQQSDTSSNNPAPATTGTGGSATKTPPTTAPGTPEPAPEPPGTPNNPAPDNDTCTPEVEPNNDIAKATLFTSRFCGKIDSGSDVDFARFVVPKTATTVTFKHSEKSGRVSYRFFFGSVPVQPEGDQLTVIPGATYNVQMRLSQSGGSGDRPTYELDVAFQ
jgi:hypothetical protein